MTIIIRDAAARDISEAARWHERAAHGQGRRFLAMADACFVRIAAAPEMYPIVYREARMGLTDIFPYLVIYRVLPDMISIVAVIHGARHPHRWRRRVREDET